MLSSAVKELAAMNLDSISRILTLRYDPLAKPARAPLSAKDFVPKKTADVEGRILEIIKDGLEDRREKLGFKRVSLSLSAGVDSGMTLAMLRKFLPDMKLDCISVGFGEKEDETGKAKEIARMYDCNFHEMVLDNLLSDLPKLIHIVKEPRWNLYHYYSIQEGKKMSNVFYAGDGGDELFGGYTFRYSKFLSLLAGSGNDGWHDRAKNYISCHERDWVPDQDKMFGRAMKFSWDAIPQALRSNFDNNLSPLDQVFLADFNGKLLHDWLPTNKAFEGSLGMKIESIFLTDEMISFAPHVRWQLKYDPETIVGKIPLRTILAGEKGFEGIKRVKKGFSADLASMWVRGAREIVGMYVNEDSDVVKQGIISAEWVKKTTTNLGKEHELRYISKMLSILAIEVWHRLFISRTMSATDTL